VIEKWRRAGDSNPDTGYPVVDFKFESPFTSPCRNRSSSLLIMPLRGPFAGLKARCRPMTNDGDSQEIAKQTGASKGVGRPSRPEGRSGTASWSRPSLLVSGKEKGVSKPGAALALSWCLDGLGRSIGVQVAGDHAVTVGLEQWRGRLTAA
jgi:hypothetical protein